MFEHDFLALFPEIFLINATIILLIYGVVFSTSKKYDYPPLVRNVGWLGLLSVLITILLVAVGSPLAVANLVYNNLIIDNFTYFCQIFLLLSTASTIVMCLDYSKQESSNAFESIVLILFSTCSMLFMISAYDLIAMYLAIELQSLCFYVIAASKRDSEFSAEAGLKYFILGAFSSGILLFGCSMIYGFTGVTNFEELAKIFTGYEITLFGAQSSGIFMGILFIAVGFLFKITAVPFHMWAPDVYEGSPTIVTAFFSIAPKISILANMLRVFIYSFYDPTWQQLFFFCSIASMILGALAAMAQNKIKRLLAYSSIGHVGYLSIGFSCGTIEGIQSLLIGTFIYVLMTVNAFAMVLALRQNRFKYIADLGALAKTNPILAITLSITMFPYAGIPPLAGFRSKFYLFFAALGCGAYLLALIGVVTSVISCFYYIRFVKIMYFDTPETWILYKPMDREKSLLLAITVFFITFFFLYPSPLFLVTHQMALCLCL
uniref:NADH dehydrogenase subunit 2 n=4 Tax=Calypogeia TaxID=41851 RepID=A0AA94YPH7_9MARC|nr:NADH dehydrogenase subunit 2 [Calypogeia integristipula]YP_009431806.1 NADH dehydrogenase subunit 2 [Calypogeia suecica]YP_010977785.1 NADH dehydrogenase subunit 2 [Calypogeia muelleriana]YP_010977827.1 NADH dehydrogenase subunit 2 [Calypogeia azurea]YP_010977869.1 NADH dehydrogenase subunit 2 [Calypogeia azorica]UYI31093.1 NADH dehydrogenase subunit 2 [Calypogeia sphagnicola f. sphagnicola]ASZ80235.1 NADH dehydrogenase subunit 2 [Calypogeia integristipula]ASZ80319.1 NADH dehydrogenase su